MGKKLVSNKEFASIVGTSEANISKTIKRGSDRIVLVPNERGKLRIDLEESLKRWGIKKSTQLSYELNKKKECDKEVQSISDATVIVDTELSKENIVSNSNNLLLLNPELDHTQAKILQASADAIKKTLDYQLQRGILIERSIINFYLPNLLTTLKNRLEVIPKRTSNLISHNIKDKFDIDIPIEELSIEVKVALEKEFFNLLTYLETASNEMLDTLVKE